MRVGSELFDIESLASHSQVQYNVLRTAKMSGFVGLERDVAFADLQWSIFLRIITKLG